MCACMSNKLPPGFKSQFIANQRELDSLCEWTLDSKIVDINTHDVFFGAFPRGKIKISKLEIGTKILQIFASLNITTVRQIAEMNTSDQNTLRKGDHMAPIARILEMIDVLREEADGNTPNLTQQSVNPYYIHVNAEPFRAFDGKPPNLTQESVNPYHVL